MKDFSKLMWLATEANGERWLYEVKPELTTTTSWGNEIMRLPKVKKRFFSSMKRVRITVEEAK